MAKVIQQEATSCRAQILHKLITNNTMRIYQYTLLWYTQRMGCPHPPVVRSFAACACYF